MTVVVAPTALVMLLGFWSLVGHPLKERTIGRLIELAVMTGLLASRSAVLGLMYWLDMRHVPIELGNWVVIPAHDYHFSVKFVFDRLECAVRHLVVRAVRHDRRVCHAVYAPRAGLQSLLRVLCLVSDGHGRDLAGRARSKRCLPVGNWSGCRRPCWWPFFTIGRHRCATGCTCGSCIASRTPRC